MVILSPAFPENEAATYWVPSQQLMVKALKKNFPQVNIIVLALLYPYHRSSYLWHDVEVISFDGMHRRKFKRPGLWRDTWKALEKIHCKNDIIGLLSFWCGECAFVANYFARKHSLKHFIWICGQDARKTNRWVPFIRPKAQQLLAMSDFLVKEFYKNHGIRPQRVIPNAIDPEMFLPTNAQRDIDILAVGSFEPLKQYDVFTNVILQLKSSLPEIHAFHCGIGREQQKIELLIKSSGLENNLELLGAKTHEETIQLMQRTKLFLHTSSYEGFSTVCIEALSAGAHVISFHYPLGHAVSHWHVVNTPEEMRTKALDLLNDPTIEYSPVLIYTMDKSAKSIMNLFSNSTTTAG